VAFQQVDELLTLAYPRGRGPRPSAITISYPALIALYHDDISDAVAYLGLRAHTIFVSYAPREAVSAYAGYGLGLCLTYWDWKKCWEEGNVMQAASILSFEYTEQALLLYYFSVRDARDYALLYGDKPSASFISGTVYRTDDEYTERITSFIVDFFKSLYHQEPHEVWVMVTGVFS
jgi:hypothetical protein